MGTIRIQFNGSFGKNEKNFTALTHGHAHAVGEVIKYLAEEVLPEAIASDHKLHSEGYFPEHGFEKKDLEDTKTFG